MELADRVALVTGASRGVGKGVALGLAEAGATIYLSTRTLKRGRGPVAADLANEYGFRDIDGTTPRALTPAILRGRLKGN